MIYRKACRSRRSRSHTCVSTIKKDTHLLSFLAPPCTWLILLQMVQRLHLWNLTDLEALHLLYGSVFILASVCSFFILSLTSFSSAATSYITFPSSNVFRNLKTHIITHFRMAARRLFKRQCFLNSLFF